MDRIVELWADYQAEDLNFGSTNLDHLLAQFILSLQLHIAASHYSSRKVLKASYYDQSLQGSLRNLSKEKYSKSLTSPTLLH